MPVVSLKEIVDRAFERALRRRRRSTSSTTSRSRPCSPAAVRGALAADRADLGQDGPVDRQRRAVRDVDGDDGRTSRCRSSLHLDHCPDRAVITDALTAGWNSVLFDASRARRSRRTSGRRSRSSREARALRRARRGRDRVDHRASRTASAPTPNPRGRPSRSRSTSSERTGVDVFAPAIGNAHGGLQDRARAGRPAGHRRRRGHRRADAPCTAAAG